MFKHFKIILPALLALSLTACSDDDPILPPPTPPSSNGMLVICQGNQYSGITGSIDAIDFTSKTVTRDAFFAANRQALGDTPQGGILKDGLALIPVFGSNLVRIVRANDLFCTQTITVSSPEALAVEANNLYVASNDGYVSRFDLSEANPTEQRLTVGPNPAGMIVSKGRLYVTISDGYNYNDGYVNGKRVAVVNLADFTLEKTIAVGLNPYMIKANETGRLFVVTRGNYFDVTPKVEYINIDGTTGTLCEGQMIDINGNSLHVLDFVTDYANDRATVSYKTYSTVTLAQTTDVNLDENNLPTMPNALRVNPTDGRIFICSDPSPSGYNLSGYVYEYASNGEFNHRYNVGVHPCDALPC